MKSEWLPIETAPRDETPLLLFSEGAFAPEAITTGVWDKWLSRWSLCQAGSYASCHDVCPQPTHWMPLPEPPL